MNLSILPLSDKDKAVLDLLLAGRCAKEIAQALNLEVSTVKNRLTRCYKKLGVDNRIACVIKLRSESLEISPN